MAPEKTSTHSETSNPDSLPSSPEMPQLQQITWAHAFRDILLTGMIKGQLLAIALVLFCLVAVIRMPSEEIPILLRETLATFGKMKNLGWTLFLVVSVAWVVVSSRARKINRSHIKHIGQEKSDLQRRVMGPDAPSSRDIPSQP